MATTSDAQKVSFSNFSMWDERSTDPLSITYSFLDIASYGLPSYYGDDAFGTLPYIDVDDRFDNSSFTDLHSDQKQAVNDLLSGGGPAWRTTFSDVANIAMTDTEHTGDTHSDSGDITFSQASMTTDEQLNGYAYNQDDARDVNDNTQDKSGIVLNKDESELANKLGQGEIGLHTLLHEVGHSMGLQDVIDTDLHNTAVDNHKYTMMSYKDFRGLKATNLQLFDIYNIQEKWGRDYTERQGDTSYNQNFFGNVGPASDTFLYTIWDGNGEDTIDASYYTARVQIDLRQGAFSSIGEYEDGGGVQFDNDPIDNLNGEETAGGYDTDGDGEADITLPENDDKGNLAIAYHTVIENATGTNDQLGGDILIGNAWDNTLKGLAGDDKLYGDGVVYGAEGDGDGETGFYADPDKRDPDNPADPRPQDGSGVDILEGGSGTDELYGGGGDDILRGGTGTGEIIDGGHGVDTLDLAPLGGGIDIYGDSYSGGGNSGSFSGIEEISLGGGDNDVGYVANSQATHDIDAGGGTDTLSAFDWNIIADTTGGGESELTFSNGQTMTGFETLKSDASLNDGIANIIAPDKLDVVDYDIDAGQTMLDYNRYTASALNFDLNAGTVSDGQHDGQLHHGQQRQQRRGHEQRGYGAADACSRQ